MILAASTAETPNSLRVSVTSFTTFANAVPIAIIIPRIPNGVLARRLNVFLASAALSAKFMIPGIVLFIASA